MLTEKGDEDYSHRKMLMKLPGRLGTFKRNVDILSNEILKDIFSECETEYIQNKIEYYKSEFEDISNDLTRTIEEIEKVIE